MNAVSNQVTPVSPSPPLDTVAANALSAQELAIESGRRTLHGHASERVLRMFDAIRNFGSPRVTLERCTSPSRSRRPKASRWCCAGRRR
jgi:hypothetical protein